MEIAEKLRKFIVYLNNYEDRDFVYNGYNIAKFGVLKLNYNKFGYTWDDVDLDSIGDSDKIEIEKAVEFCIKELIKDRENQIKELESLRS
jgi:hypothetical protein